MNSFIKAISYYLPEQVLSNVELNDAFPEWSVDKISEKTGIHERHISGDDEFSSDLAIKAATKLFSEHSINKKDIDYIFFCTQSPDYFLPTTACIIQNKLGIPVTSGAIDFNLGCSGFVYGLGLAKGLIETGQCKNILLLTGETYSKFIYKKDKSVKTIFGDAAAATLIASRMEIGIDNFVYGTDGSGADKLIVKTGGMRYPKTVEGASEFVDNRGNIRTADSLFMDGSEIFAFTLSAVPNLIQSVLEKGNLGMDDIDLFIFHQANAFMLEALRKKIGINNDKFFIHLKDCGNTVSSTIPIALYEAIKQNRAKKGNKILLAGFGVGYSWAANLIYL